MKIAKNRHHLRSVQRHESWALRGHAMSRFAGGPAGQCAGQGGFVPVAQPVQPQPQPVYQPQPVSTGSAPRLAIPRIARFGVAEYPERQQPAHPAIPVQRGARRQVRRDLLVRGLRGAFACAVPGYPSANTGLASAWGSWAPCSLCMEPSPSPTSRRASGPRGLPPRHCRRQGLAVERELRQQGAPARLRSVSAHRARDPYAGPCEDAEKTGQRFAHPPASSPMRLMLLSLFGLTHAAARGFGGHRPATGLARRHRPLCGRRRHLAHHTERSRATIDHARRWEDRPAISPDVQAGCLRRDHHGRAERYSLPVDGGLPVRHTFDNSSPKRISWTPDGRILSLRTSTARCRTRSWSS